MGRGIRTLIVATASLLAAVEHAAGHHAAVEYDLARTVALQGVISKLQWESPHISFVVDVRGNDGKVERWDFEGNGTGQTVASGLSRELLKVGTRVKIKAHPAQDTSSRDALFITLEINGRVFARRPGFEVE